MLVRWMTESPARTWRRTMSISISPSLMVGTIGRSVPNARRVITIERASSSSGEKGMVRMSSTPRSKACSLVLRSPRRVLGTDRPIVPTIRLGEIEIDIVNRQVKAGDSVVHLSGIEQSVLYLLASRSGRVVTRDEILDAIWGPDFVAESNIVDRHIRSLRIKLQNDYRHPRFIATVPGQGYRFIPTFSNMGWAGQRDAGERAPH